MFCIHQNSNYYKPSRCVLTTPKWATTPPRCSVRKRYNECVSSTPEPVCFLCTKVARFATILHPATGDQHLATSGDIVARFVSGGDIRHAPSQPDAGCWMLDASVGVSVGVSVGDSVGVTCDRHKPRGSKRAGPQAATASLLPASRGQRPETSVLVTIKHNAES